MAKIKAKKEFKTKTPHKYVVGHIDKKFHTRKSIVFVREGNEAVAHAETDEEFMLRHGVYEKLLAQIKTATPSKNLKAELDEL